MAVALGAFSACSTYQATPGDSGDETGAPIQSIESSDPVAGAGTVLAEPQQQQQQTVPTTSTPTDNSLLARAKVAAAGGSYNQALSLLERAQRIDPTNAEIYIALVHTYAAKGDMSLAETTAERGLLYCRSERQCDQLRAYANPR